MEGLKQLPYVALVLAISGVIVGAAVLSLDSFGDTLTQCENATDHYNATEDECWGTGENDYRSNVTAEYQVILDATEGENSMAEQFPTLGIIAVMTVIIGIVAGVFVYLKYFR